MQLKTYITVICCIFFFNTYSQTDTLKVVEIHSKKDSILKITVINSNVPYYILTKDKLNELASEDIGDALKFIPGTYIKDYGGIGGLKTISYRSLGAAHTQVEVDGVILPNTQTGTVNLSNFDVFSIDKLEMTSGQVQDDYSTASSYASSNLLSIKSNLFVRSKQSTKIRLLGAASSINSYQTGILWQQNISQRISIGAQGLYSFGSGRYPFNIQNIDSTYSANRINSNLENIQLKGALNYDLKKLKIHLNTTFNKNFQKLPGAVILYNPYNDQSLKLKTINSTISVQYSLKKYAIGFNSFYQNAETIYRDNQFLNSQGFLENDYNNRIFRSGFIVNKFLKSKTQKIFLSSDLKISKLTGDQFITSPKRTHINSVLGLSKWIKRLKIQANITHQFIFDQTPQSTKKISHFSPFIAIAYLPFKSKSLRFRTHYKNTYRLPSFNDLYYNSIGNSNLKSENAESLNLGITYGHKKNNWTIQITTDVYRNSITDKIVAIPTKNLFNWSMQNIGSVLSHGIDFNVFYTIKKNKTSLHFTTSQSLNKSLDVTNQNSPTYGHQIPYTPVYNGNYTLSLGYMKTYLSLTTLHSGKRYVLNENIPFNELPGFIDFSCALSKTVNFKNQTLYVNLQAANLLNKNYEVIKSFPMPGRYYRLKLIYNL